MLMQIINYYSLRKIKNKEEKVSEESSQLRFQRKGKYLQVQEHNFEESAYTISQPQEHNSEESAYAISGSQEHNSEER
ncbi:hypothetical protein Glove_202g92 [Diversispora epigaea]|uniref:Uncharacterized protein n=1 Tax=Diversispora epigaea TaxID=1348612 RepID=A0A397IPL3_9GLOM|nr:hypothetical protein Glove_202g92 [Diversispora epigaea]